MRYPVNNLAQFHIDLRAVIEGIAIGGDEKYPVSSAQISFTPLNARNSHNERKRSR